jgi:hypothetical protein
MLQDKQNRLLQTTFLSVHLLLVLRAHGHGVAIAANASVLVSRIVLAGCLALEHLAVLWDAVALALGNGVLSIHGVALGWGPGEVVAANLNVVVGKLAELVIVHTEKLGLLGSTELETGDLVDDEGEDGADGEGVNGNGDNVRDLLVDRGGGTGNGTSRDTVVNTVEANDVVGTENAVEEKSDHSSDTVLSEHIEGIVNLDPELDCKLISIVISRLETNKTYSWWQS